MQHGEVVLRQDVAQLGGHVEEGERLLRVGLGPPAVQVHHAQMEPRLHMPLPRHSTRSNPDVAPKKGLITLRGDFAPAQRQGFLDISEGHLGNVIIQYDSGLQISQSCSKHNAGDIVNNEPSQAVSALEQSNQATHRT